MRYHYDWEFKENGHTIEPISLGMVADDGRELYIINTRAIDNFRARARQDRLDDTDRWLQGNVFKHISHEDENTYGMDFLTELVGHKVYDFITDIDWSVENDVEFWGYFAAYDHVCLSQLFGRMIDLPSPMPMYTNELMTIRAGRAKPPRPANLPEHNALADAKYQKLIFEAWKDAPAWLLRYARQHDITDYEELL
jgi:hypothetical protein